MFISMIYHSQTNNQSERTNQIIEIAFRFHLTIKFDDIIN